MKKKRNGDQTLAKYKARLVACDNVDIECWYVYLAPVINFKLVKLFLPVSKGMKWHVCQTDFCNAFVNRKLERNLYVKFPKKEFMEGKREKGVMHFAEKLIWFTRGTRNRV